MAVAGVVDIDGKVIIDYNRSELTLKEKMTLFQVYSAVLAAGVRTLNPVNRVVKNTTNKKGASTSSVQYVLIHTWSIDEQY